MAHPSRAHVDWSRDAVVYQLNTRQFTDEGTIAAAAEHLPRLASLGVDIVWLMPIHPIGEKNRKGSLGSPYAITDYMAVREELGTLDDLTRFVDSAHGLGLKLIIDWVANHTAWDHPWASAHPDWYKKDWKGDFVSTPFWDWTDIIDLDYSAPGLRATMKEAMLYWVREADIDGYRCDVAHYVPRDFWEDVREALEAVKPVWMLAEGNARDLHEEAFDATYAWEWQKPLRRIGAGKADATALYEYYSENASMWPADAQRMLFTTNHDQNTWDGLAQELLGPAYRNALVLMFASEGIPLVYNGQEAGLDKQLAFFERDPIAWCEHEDGDFIRNWLVFRKAHPALHNRPWGGRMVHVKNSDEAKVFSFARLAEEDGVLVAQNYSGEDAEIELGDVPHTGRWSVRWTADPMADPSRSVFGGVAPRPIEKGATLHVPAWSSLVYVLS
ncbi:alpha-amylase family glycosyl hydrolase [Sphingomicrobium sediminis]|uniref:Alpha-amylase family glycosyl hydrolase n=1 Tax=Sphingomicrobium sediminis TaxID=2950949 RepID=A0A9X2EEP4_9SPHN|nr:alpha-amylase family glycosyl hydrolase [Sphingomicrobium sediminis]MCM8556220.1 alpha-amylase family glycosyl hydrolase [Sphingomicrobium sediminis]